MKTENLVIKSFYTIEIQYFPCINWYKLFKDEKYFKIEQYENFQKMSFRNRAIISGSNGLINLTVPLQKGREQKASIKEVKVESGITWRYIHWRAIVSSYSRSPFFEHFSDTVHRLLFLNHTYLFDLNLEIIQTLNTVLGLNNPVLLTEAFVEPSRSGNSQDFRNRWLPRNFREDAEDWQPKYMQVFSDKFGFIPNLSILDLLFCNGGF